MRILGVPRAPVTADDPLNLAEDTLLAGSVAAPAANAVIISLSAIFNIVGFTTTWWDLEIYTWSTGENVVLNNMALFVNGSTRGTLMVAPSGAAVVINGPLRKRVSTVISSAGDIRVIAAATAGSVYGAWVKIRKVAIT